MKKLKYEDNSFQEILEESVKCHHIDITNYFEKNYHENSYIYYYSSEGFYHNLISYAYHYYNYIFFSQKSLFKIFFCYACLHDHLKIVEILLKTNEIDINEPLIYIYILLISF